MDAFFAGFFWLIFSPAFQMYLQIPENGTQPLFSAANCTKHALFEYKGISTECASQGGVEGFKHYFESALHPNRFLSSRCGNMTLRRANHVNNAFTLQASSVPGMENSFHFVQQRTQRILVVSSDGLGKFVDGRIVHASPLLQKRASLNLIAVRPSRGSQPVDDVCRLYEDDKEDGLHQFV
eukprot:scpid95053/ scgid21582/ 